MTESQPIFQEDLPISARDARAYSKAYTKSCKRIFDSKFPLVQHTKNGTTVMENEIITENNGIYNILYLPFDKTREDKEEQIKISNDRQGITIILVNDYKNPSIAFDLFEADDEQPERKKIISKNNTREAVYRASKLISELSGLVKFDLAHTTLDDSN